MVRSSTKGAWMDGPERVEVPLSRRRLVLPGVVLPAVLVVLYVGGIAAGGPHGWNTVFGLVIWVGVVVALLVDAGRRRNQPALILDTDGIHGPDGELLVPWSKVALVWVARDLPERLPKILRPMRISVWDDPAFAFAHRASFRPTARMTRTVPTELTPAELVGLVERFVRAPVETGDRARARQVLQQLTDG